MTKVSVVVPVYNTENYLSRCIESLIKQTLQDIEIICINDGSTDKCGSILSDFAHKDKRIKVINQANKGLSAARNAGVAASTGEYISFIDSDDYVTNSFLEQLYLAIVQTNCDISGCDFAKIYAKDIVSTKIASTSKYKSALDVLLHKKNFIHFNVWNKMYKASLVKGIEFEEGLYYEDWVYNCEAFDKANGFVWLNEKLYGYNMLSSSIMRSDFTQEKCLSYINGIKMVAHYFSDNTEKWLKVRKTVVSRVIKTLMNFTISSEKSALKSYVSQQLQQLYEEKLITYRGLSLKNKLKLFKFLHHEVINEY